LTEEQVLLSIRSLTIDYVGERSVRAVDNLSLDIERGEFVGLLGESGSGKSSAALGALRLLPPPAVIRSGQVLLEGLDLLSASDEQLRSLRFRRSSVVLQSAMHALSPVLTIGEQISDVILAHEDVGREEALERSAELLELVGIARSRLRDYPHRFSGGMRQRVALAMALALRPALVVLDEPTTALDVLIEREILEQLATLRRSLGFSVLFVSHDVRLLLEHCDRLAVLYAGRLCEVASKDELARGGRHPYTRGLLEALPSLGAARRRLPGIPGAPPDLARPPAGCRFHPRCGQKSERCGIQVPELAQVESRSQLACHHPLGLRPSAAVPEAEGDDRPTAPDPFEVPLLGTSLGSDEETSPMPGVVPRSERARQADEVDTEDPPAVETGLILQNAGSWAQALLEARQLVKVFRSAGGAGSAGSATPRAVDDVSFQLAAGEIVALVGESGSGKSTVLRLLAGLEAPSSGEVWLGGAPGLGPRRGPSLAFRRRVQIVLQDPFASLNPVHTVAHHLERALLGHRLAVAAAALLGQQLALLEQVGLAPASDFLPRRPHELSGGQRQRVAIARALAVEPEVILADEPTSMLDVSVRAGILNLLSDLKRERGLSILLVTHDLASARYVADRILVLDAGRIVESGPTEELLRAPAHPKTRQLLAAARFPGLS